MYYSYHSQIRKRIAAGHLTGWQILDDYHGIKPALVLYFDDHIPMPVRRHRWNEYFELLKEKGLL